MSSVPSYWGPVDGVDSKDYLLLMEGDTPTSAPISLIGHALTNPSADSSDALQVTRVELKNGRIRTVVRTKRAAEVRSRSYTIGFPAGALWTPAQQAAFRKGCRKTFFMKYLCPEDRRYNHVDVFPDAVMDEPVEEGDLITIDDTVTLSSTSNITVTEKLRLWQLGFELVYDAAAAYRAVAFQSVDCPGCGDATGLAMFAGGGDGTAIPLLTDTDDRFSSVTARTTGGALTEHVKAIATKGDIVVVGVADEADATATAGSLRVSSDGGASFVAISGISLPVQAVTFVGDMIVAVGGIDAGPAQVWVSADRGATWVASTSSALPATSGAFSIAADGSSTVYIGCADGTLLKGTFTGAVLNLVDISANLPTVSTTLTAVHVYAPNHVAVGSTSNYYVESFDGGATFAAVSLPGTAAVNGIAGTSLRSVVALADGLAIRDVSTDFVFQRITLENGQTVTGDFTAVAMNLDNDFNIFVAVTDDGEVVFGKPFYPNA